MGLFVMVGGLVESGVWTRSPTASPASPASDLLGVHRLLLWGSGCCPAIVDNIPYVATHEPGRRRHRRPGRRAAGAVVGVGARRRPRRQRHPVGASANVVVAGIAARNGTPIGFWQFTRYGLVVAGATLVVSTLYVWLRYFVLAG